ncbi:kelch domain-containing protein 10-like [Ornithodoros turicata]
MVELFCFRPFTINILQPKSDSVPKPRSGHRIVASGGNVYAFGGYNPENEGDDPNSFLFKELWHFNTDSKRWTNLDMTGDIPSELASHAALLRGDTLLVYGGTAVPFGERISNKLYACNLRTCRWTLLPAEGDFPEEQYGQAMCLHNGALYVVGGTTGFEYSMDVHRLSLPDLTWKRLHTLQEPKSRYRHELVSYSDMIYVLGGGTARTSLTLHKVPAFNTKLECWETVPTNPDQTHGYPTKRRCHGCVQYKSKAYICGGHDGNGVLDDVWELDLQTLHWTRLQAQLPKSVYFHSGAVSETGQMFVFGGVTSSNGSSRCNTLWSMWVTVPPLLEMAWLSLLHYCPQLANTPATVLTQAGVPRALVQRLLS